MSRQPSIPDVKDFADVAQWLLRFVANENFEGSSPFIRSKFMALWWQRLSDCVVCAGYVGSSPIRVANLLTCEREMSGSCLAGRCIA